MDWIQEHPDKAQLAQAHRTRSSPRRSHTKSRLGCQPCKARRIKCDELRPECTQCVSRKANCVYNIDNQLRRSSLATQSASASSQPERSKSESSSRHEDEGSHTTGSVTDEHDSEIYRAQILQSLFDANIPRRHYVAPVYRQEDNEEILNHFFDDEDAWIGPPEIQQTMQRHGARLAVSAPYLMHAIMAFSASHLNYTQPGDKKYEVAHTIHFGFSLHYFTSQLSKPIAADNSDSLFACAFLHSMLAFWQQARVEVDTEPFKWLRTCRGVPTLQTAKAINARLGDSLWHDAFCAAGQREGGDVKILPAPDDPESLSEQWVTGMVQKFETLCLVSLEHGPDGASVYAPPLRHLRQLLRMNIDFRSTGAMMIFNGKLSPQFVDLLEGGDIRAMLMFSYWYALMCNIKQWWAIDQALRDCRRICQALITDEDPIVQELLQWPMHQCGLSSDLPLSLRQIGSPESR